MDAQTLQNLVSLAILIFGVISIWLNWRKDTPPSSPATSDGWRELYERSERERTHTEQETLREVALLNTKIAVLTCELELMRGGQAPSLNVSTNVIGSGAQTGQTSAGTDNTQKS